jgi:STE24 endopeptidase
MEHTIFYIIIVIFVADYIFDRILDYLDSTKRSATLPEEVKGIYDEAKYRKSQDYERANTNFSLLTDSLSFILVLLMLFMGGFAFIDDFARSVTENSILVALIFFGMLMFASDLLGIPFEAYHTFEIEEKFGFTKTTVKTFILDKLKGWILSAIIGGGLMSVIIWFYTMTGKMFWIYAWVTVTAFSLFMAMFYSNLIVPLFNKQTPLEKGELRDEIEKFSNKVKFKLDNIFIIDGSKRSTKANAYFTGFGPKKRIVLYDTLVKEMTNSEIVAVLAHEIGHYKKRHIISSLIIGTIQTGVVLFIFSLFVSNPILSKALGVNIPGFHIALITFGILYSPLSTILGIAMNVYSRSKEFEADRFAKDNYDGEALGMALKKLSVKNLSNLTPHPVNVFVGYSHPPLLQRLKALVKLN